MTGVTIIKNTESRVKKALSTSRTIIHLMVVGVAYLLGHLFAPDATKRWVSVGLCAGVILFDQLRFRLPILARVNQWMGKVGALRPKELTSSSSATHLATIIGLPLLCQIPIWILVPTFVTFAAGDAFAREIGGRFGKGYEVWRPDGKTWVGYWSYILAANAFGLITVLWLNKHFPLYPNKYSDLILCLGVIVSSFVGATAELWCEKIPEEHSGYLDDNLVVPVAAMVAFSVTVFAWSAM